MDFKQDVEKRINKKLKNSQLLLGLSILIAGTVAVIGYITEQNLYLWAIYFVIIGALSLPNINKCKKDLLDFKQNNVSFTEGKVVDIFPEDKDEGNWIMFLDVKGKRKIAEFSFPKKPSVEMNSTIKLFHTKILIIPTRIEVVSK